MLTTKGHQGELRLAGNTKAHEKAHPIPGFPTLSTPVVFGGFMVNSLHPYIMPFSLGKVLLP
jgi:hypothetical protein